MTAPAGRSLRALEDRPERRRSDPPPARPARHLESLNEKQSEAVRHFKGPLLVVAGAGSGKTRVLTARICHLVHELGVHPARIMAVTFTNKAAGEMRSRVVHLLGEEPRGMWVGTFHSIGARLLRRHARILGWSSGFTVFDAEEQTRLVREILKRLPKGGSVRTTALRARISELKQELLTVGDYRDALGGGISTHAGPLHTLAAQALPLYERALKERNAFDFDDLILWPLRLFEMEGELVDLYRERFAFVLVDEYQDTNHAQFRFIDEIGRGHGNLMVVGDPDQAIYGWRGADVRNILDFERSYRGARTVTLEKNYRSRERILAAANAVIEENLDRPEKRLQAVRAGGSKVTLLHARDDASEAAWIAQKIRDRALDEGSFTWRDFAILYRTNAQSRALESELLLRGVPYQVVGGVRFYERREIQDVVSYLRLIANPADASAFSRAVGYPKRGIGAKSRERVVDWAAREGVTVLEACRKAREIPGIRPQAARSLGRFASLIDKHRDTEQDVSSLIQSVVDAIDMVGELCAEGPEGEDRVRNVEELVAGAASFAVGSEDLEEGDPELSVLSHFLQQVSLLADVDRHDSEENSVSLMTLHNAKGLEFPVVFITGAEEGLLPLMRSDDEPGQIEEERRLFYVGITRAEDSLTISWARRRRRAGQYLDGIMSSFVRHIPRDSLDHRSCGRGRDFGYGRFGVGPRRTRDGWDEGRYGDPGDRGAPGRKTAPEPFGYRARSAPLDEASAGQGLAPEDESQDAPRLIRGSRVRHPRFGSGVVVDATGFGLNVKVVVEFDDSGRKSLSLRHSKLESDWP